MAAKRPGASERDGCADYPNLVRVAETAAHSNSTGFHNANRLSVDIPPMADLDDEHYDLSIADLVKDAVVADPDPEVLRASG